MLSHHDVESVLYVSQGVLYELFLPTVINHFSADDPTDIDIRLAGVLAESLIDTTFMSIPLSDAMNDFCTFISEGDNAVFATGTSLSADHFKTKDDTPSKMKPPADFPISIVRIPLMIPKLKGHTIHLGSIRDDKVVESVAEYHTVAEAWISAHVYFKEMTAEVSPQAFPDNLPATSTGG